MSLVGRAVPSPPLTRRSCGSRMANGPLGTAVPTHYRCQRLAVSGWERQRRNKDSRSPRTLSVRLLTTTRLAGDDVGGAHVEVLLRGFVGRGGGEELEGLEVIRLHGSVVRSREATTSQADESELQREQRNEAGEMSDNAFSTADITRGGVMDECGSGLSQDDRDNHRSDQGATSSPAGTLSGTAKDFGSRGWRGAGHGRSDIEQPCPAGNPALGRVGTASRHSTPTPPS